MDDEAEEIEPGSERDKAIRLFKYLQELARLRSRAVLSVDQYDQTLWLKDLAPDVDEVGGPDTEGWLTVPRVALPTRPETPMLLGSWVDEWDLDNWQSEPALHDEATFSNEIIDANGERRVEDETHLRADHPEVDDAWGDYYSDWYGWARQREQLDPAYRAYQRLFTVHQRAQQLGEQYEVFVGVGLLAWGLPKPIRRHLIAAGAELDLDTITGSITIRPTELTGDGLRFETEMVPAELRPTTEDVGNVAETVASIGDPFEREAVADVLRAWVLAADPDGKFQMDWDPPGSSAATPTVSFSPALCLRKRSHRSLEATYEDILGQLQTDAEIPDTIGDLVSLTGASLREDSAEEVWLPGAGHKFFPLAANEQQRQIVDEMTRRRGLVVQGPPGTGKSQTIANLICHALSVGQRVLVTSHTVRALKVLQDKLPDEFRQLAVSVLGQGREGSEDVKRSANTLLSRMSDPAWSDGELSEQVDRLEQRIAELQDERLDVLDQLHAVDAARGEPVDLAPGYSGLMPTLIEQLAAQQGSLGWIIDESLTGSPPVSDTEVKWLVDFEAWATDQPTEVLDRVVPDPDGLLAAEDLGSMLDKLRTYQEELKQAGEGSGLRETFGGWSGQKLKGVLDLAKAVTEQEDVVNRRSIDWLHQARVDVEAGRDEAWRDLFRQTSEVVTRSQEIGGFTDSEPMALSIEQLEALAYQGDNVVSHLEQGGSLRKILKPKALRDGEAFLNLTLGGRPLVDEATCSDMILRLRFSVELRRCESRWGDRLIGPAPTVGASIARLVDARESLGLLLALHDRRVALGEALELTDPEIHPTSADSVVAEVAAATMMVESSRLMAQISSAAKPLRATVELPDAHPAIRQSLEAIRAMNIPDYAAALAELKEAYPTAEAGATATRIRTKLRGACPATEGELSRLSEHHDVSEFEAAWYWRQAMGTVAGLTDDKSQELFGSLSVIGTQLSESIAELGAVSAWRHTISRLSDEQATHLKAYQAALRRLGKGTGKRAASHRAEARRHLDACQSAIPAWIMPTYRVAETLQAKPGAFDLVIVDEASQSGVDALFLLWLGKQIVIVGDDNQISPANVGLREDAVARLQRDYLHDFELRDVLDAKHSLFDQAKVRYTGETWLTEHFRCMPEIIEFSNRLLYAPQHHRLEPLRQFGMDRLPPLQRVRVHDAREEGSAGSKVNRTEAEMVVRQIVACHGDDSYEGKTFGVISLLGATQAAYIEQELFERLGADAWRERDLRCGDGYAFQGDERDVIFLSMVKSLDEGRSAIPKLGAPGTNERFNVAASRAKDQMWLFHSMGLEELNAECVRAKLLRHFLEPQALGITGFTEPVDRDIRRSPFDSLFEQRVFLDLRERGYVVEPQHRVYGKRIDLVIAGSGGRLAVECDGAAFHGPDEFADDVARQQELERIGWTFHRISDLDYYLDQESTIDALVEQLSTHGIFPEGAAPPARQESVPSPSPAEIEPAHEPTPALLADSDEAQALLSTSTTREPPPSERLEPAESLWAEEALPASASSNTAAGGLAPYVEWEPYEIAQPIHMPVADLARVLVDIVDAEGPILAERLFQIANRAAGNQRGGRLIRESIRAAVDLAIEEGRLAKTDSSGEGPLHAVLRTPTQSSVRLRAPGTRTIHEYPPQELTALISHVEADRFVAEEQLFRDVLEVFGSKRLAEKTSSLLRERRQNIFSEPAAIDPTQG